MTGLRVIRRVAVLLTVLLLLLILPTRAEESEAIEDVAFPKEYGEMLAALPDAVRDSLPEAMLSTDPDEVSAALEAFLSPKALLSYFAEMIFSQGAEFLQLLASVCGILLLRAVLNCLGEGLGSASGAVFGSICRISVAVVLLAQVFSTLAHVTDFFHSLQAITQAYLPLMAALYAMGGNVATAAVNQSTLVFANALVGYLGSHSVIPVFSACLALSLVGVFEGNVAARTSHISAKIKKWYTTAISLTMMLLTASLSAQTVLTARADSMGFRTVRFIVSSNIPLVGGNVAEMLRTAASGLSWLRSLVGVGGILLLLWLVLPIFVRVLVVRGICMLGSDAAVWLGCPDEARLLSELGSLYGYLLAVISVCTMTFFFSMVLLFRCAVAYGG